MAQYKNFPRWKAGVIFAFLQWFASSVLVLILHPTSDRFENIIEAGIYAIAAGILYVLVDGEFVIEKKNIMLKFRGSENQRIIDVQLSLKTGKVVVISDDKVE